MRVRISRSYRADVVASPIAAASVAGMSGSDVLGMIEATVDGTAD